MNVVVGGLLGDLLRSGEQRPHVDVETDVGEGRCDDLLAAVGRPDIMIVVGGVIPPGDFAELYSAGATAIFPPGTVIADAAVDLLHKLADRLGYDLS